MPKDRILDMHMHLADLRHPEWIRMAARRDGTERYCVLSLAMKADPLNNLACLRVKQLDPENAYAFCSLTYDGGRNDYLRQLRMWKEAGFDGWKILEAKPNYAARNLYPPLDDEQYEPAFAFAEAERFPIVLHVGDPAPCWQAQMYNVYSGQTAAGCYYQGGYPTLKNLYRQTENILRRHPGLHLSLAHLYFTSDDQPHARRLLETYPNLRMDLTPGAEMYLAFQKEPHTWRQFFLEFGDRLMFGSDTEPEEKPDMRSPAQWPSGFVQRFLCEGGEQSLFGNTVKGFDLPEKVRERILYQNFVDFVGGEPHGLNRRILGVACQWVQQVLDNLGRHEESELGKSMRTQLLHHG